MLLLLSVILPSLRLVVEAVLRCRYIALWDGSPHVLISYQILMCHFPTSDIISLKVLAETTRRNAGWEQNLGGSFCTH